VSRERHAFLALAAFFAADGFGLANWAARIPAVKAGHHLSSGKLGVVLFAIALGAALSMAWTGALASRAGSLRTLYVAAIVYLAGLALLAQPSGRWTLTATALLFGVGFGAMNVALNAHAVALEAAVGRPIMSRLHAAFSGGGLLGALTGGLAAAGHVSPRLHLALVAAFGTAAAVVFAPGLAIVDGRARGAPLFARPQRALLALGVIGFCSLLGEGAAADWSALFLHSSAGASAAVAAAGYFAFSGAMVLGRLSGDWTAQRYGATRPLRAFTVLAAAGLTIALIDRTTALGILGFTMLGLGLATVVPNVFRAAARATPLAPASGVAAVSTLGWLGFLAGPPIIGALASATSLPVALGLVVLALTTISTLAPLVDPRPASSSRTHRPERPRPGARHVSAS
jgi:fucose permease